MKNNDGISFLDETMRSIIFYEVKIPSPQEAISFMDEIVLILNEKPTNIQVGFNGNRKSISPRYIQIQKYIDDGIIENYTYMTAVNYFQKGNIRDCSLMIGFTNFAPGSRISIIFKRNREVDIDLENITRNVMNSFKPDYGIGYDLTLREGPFWFSSGMISSGMSQPLRTASGEFKEEYYYGKRFSDGFFRDVFRWNYLSVAHLNREVQGLRFKDWVLEPSDSSGRFDKPKSRGKLTILENDCAIWKLEVPEILEVRPQMLQAGLLMVKS